MTDDRRDVDKLTLCLTGGHIYSPAGWCTDCGMPDSEDPPTTTHDEPEATPMTARVFGPIEVEPGTVWPPYDRTQFLGAAALHTALLDATQGIELGAYDRSVLRWLAGWEIGTVAVVVSLLHRARAAGVESSTGLPPTTDAGGVA